ncbi:hypothetical protein GQR58_029198 [Nymphon striatum]|nr:hypothetical protein GQR58_029198 [Nymphon striatum]
MLTIRAWLAPQNRGGVDADWFARPGGLFAVALHVELLQVCREAFERLAVRQDCVGLPAPEVAVPNAQQPSERGSVRFQGSGAEVFVDDAEALEKFVEGVRTNGAHQREPDSSVDRVTAADPIPELEHVRRVDTERFDPLGVCGNRNEVTGDGGLVVQRSEQPRARGASVRHGLDGGEGLGRDDKERGCRIEIDEGSFECCHVDVGNEAHCEFGGSEMSQCTSGHERPKIRAANTDVDHCGNCLAGCSEPLTRPDLIGDTCHLGQHLSIARTVAFGFRSEAGVYSSGHGVDTSELVVVQPVDLTELAADVQPAVVVVQRVDLVVDHDGEVGLDLTGERVEGGDVGHGLIANLREVASNPHRRGVVALDGFDFFVGVCDERQHFAGVEVENGQVVSGIRRDVVGVGRRVELAANPDLVTNGANRSTFAVDAAEVDAGVAHGALGRGGVGGDQSGNEHENSSHARHASNLQSSRHGRDCSDRVVTGAIRDRRHR